jgi:hypothetical protein
MKLTKRSTGIAAAVVMAGGLAAATSTSAFAAAPHTPAKPTADKDGKADHDKDAKGKKGDKDGDEHSRFLHGTHGERTVKGKDGKTVVHEWQVGKVTSASGTNLTVLSSDGTSWSWTGSAQTRVVGQGKGTTVKVGDEVLVEGVKAGTANDARVVLDPGAAKIAQWQADKDDAAKPGKGKHRKVDDARHADGKGDDRTA